ncbi:MAG: shikimate dehydrogenase [Clostridiales Family XIII bacterium]|jgi:shikimate dehydrogenase|nr:shikimate dehydrogenase [Clostridiales Family XIII bacterium]
MGRRAYCLIGDPVAHSLSPLLHGTAFALLGADAVYEKIRVAPESLEDFVAEGAFDGYNITIPHKERVIPLLDELAGDALAAGAVNTAVRDGGKTVGYNTDMEGLLLALRGQGRGYAGSVVCVLGTGGAARGCAKKAALEGARDVRIVGRSREKAEGILPGAYAGPLSEEAVRGADIFVNATPLGMAGYAEDFADTAFLGGLPAHALVYDCVYTPRETTLVRAARARGLSAESGLSMLVWQGLLSEALWGVAGRDALLGGELYQEVFGVLDEKLRIEN